MTRKITQAKKCRECGKGIREWNKSGLCGHHATMARRRKKREKRKKEGICVGCAGKIEPIITYPAGNTIPAIIKYPDNCYNCRDYSLDKKRKKEKLCAACGRKVEPVITHPAGDTIPAIIKYPLKCYACRVRQINYALAHQIKKYTKTETVTTL